MTFAIFFAASIVTAGQSFDCTPVRVWDGDGPIWCLEGPRVRLAGIAAKEIGEFCEMSQPCPTASAIEARDALVTLIGEPIGMSREGHILVKGPTMRCVSVGSGVGMRTAAWCVSPKGGDLSCAMVRGGWALQWEEYWRGHRCR